MESRTLAQIAEYLDIETTCPQVVISGIERDNRNIKLGDLFVAIRGEKFDGHDFVLSAAKNGAVAALTSKKIENCPIPCLVVEDTVQALQKIARAYRAEFSAKVVGVTGSVGKTTTKEMIASVLREKYSTLKTLGNLNNEIGLPFTVLNLNSSHEAAVIEMGTNHFGEISRLTAVACPDIAVISTIGESHIEFLGSKEGILRAKLEILEGLRDDGVVILNGDDEYLWSVRSKVPFKTKYYGISNQEVDYFGIVKQKELSEITFSVREIEKTEFAIHVGGTHNIQNALAAIAVGRELNLSTEQIQRGLDAFENTGMRQKIIEIDGKCIINDAYNANPDSMRAALNLLQEVRGRKIAILADMLELGDASHSAHLAIGGIASEIADFVFTTGDMREVYARGAVRDNVRCFENAEDISNEIKKIWQKGDTLLVKASRGMRLERVIDGLCK